MSSRWGFSDVVGISMADFEGNNGIDPHPVNTKRGGTWDSPSMESLIRKAVLTAFVAQL